MNKRDFVSGLSHAGIWIGLWLAVENLMNESAARSVYALLCAWWATLYVSLLVRTTWKGAAVFAVIMSILFVIGAMVDADFLYHDLPSLSVSALMIALVMQLILWLSPFVINAIACRLRLSFQSPST